ncbi:MAG: hypothetical protein WC959_09775 [Kiritimatiellales bacterium]
MKKWVILLASASIAAGIFAESNTVTSANILGYVKVDAPPAGAFDILSLVQFSKENDEINIQDAISNLNELNASTTWENADKLYVWTGTSYKQYGLYADGTDVFWMGDDASRWTLPFVPAMPATITLRRGNAVWYTTGNNAVPAKILISGDVFMDSSFNTEVYAGFSLIAYPYSSDISLADLSISNATASSTWGNADKLYAWTGTSYKQYGLYDDGTSVFWMGDDASRWTLPFVPATPATNTISLSKGFWYESVSEKIVGFDRIYLND